MRDSKGRIVSAPKPMREYAILVGGKVSFTVHARSPKEARSLARQIRRMGTLVPAATVVRP